MGDWWGYLGWALYLSWLFLGYFGFAATPPAAAFTLAGLLLVWWLIDVLVQYVPLWKVLVGVVMLVMSCLPFGAVFIIGVWALYWTRVRE